MNEYTEIPEAHIPGRVIFHTPRRNQGQFGEVSYGDPHNYADGADEGAPYMRERDDENVVRYYCLTSMIRTFEVVVKYRAGGIGRSTHVVSSAGVAEHEALALEKQFGRDVVSSTVREVQSPPS